MATWHPAAVLRNRSLESDVLLDLAHFRDHVIPDKNGIVLDPQPSQYCVKCSHEASHWTDNMIPWCRKHWDWKNGLSGQGRVTNRPRQSKTRHTSRGEPML